MAWDAAQSFWGIWVKGEEGTTPVFIDMSSNPNYREQHVRNKVIKGMH